METVGRNCRRFRSFSTMFLMALETLLLNRRSIGPEVPLVEATEERAREELHGDIMRPLLDFPLVAAA